MIVQGFPVIMLVQGFPARGRVSMSFFGLKFGRLFASKNQLDDAEFTIEHLKSGEIPKHIAIIMDGNGRWANQRGLPRIAGHRSGMKSVKRITKAADALGVEVLTMYAFSTENWKRPEQEVAFLMKLPEEFILTELDELIENNVQVRFMGEKDQLPEHTLKAVHTAVKRTEQNTGLILNFALNYGGRRELLLAMKAAAEQGKPEQIDEEWVEQQLQSSGLPNPDYLIRTSGELRISNFMLWQLAYAEFYFTDKLWPDFDESEFHRAIEAYQNRNRRFGGVKS